MPSPATTEAFETFIQELRAADLDSAEGVKYVLELVLDSSDEAAGERLRKTLDLAGAQFLIQARDLLHDLGADEVEDDDSAALFIAMVAMGYTLNSR